MLFKYISGKFSWVKGVTPGSKLKSYNFGPSNFAMNSDSSQKYSGISTYNSSMTFPVYKSSSQPRRMFKILYVSGKIPPPVPEWVPFEAISTFKLNLQIPLRVEVNHRFL